jgi:enamine deaminase RidA (YjgF/YER057c/UK114 family)
MPLAVEARLRKLGLTIPAPPRPVGAYVPSVVTGPYVFVAGEGATVNDEFVYTGKVGRDLTRREGYDAARLAGLNCLASLKAAVGDLDRVERIVKVVGYVNSVPEFTEHPQVVNGASELFLRVFQARGRHARVAVGVSGLPGDSAVEVSLIAKLKA